MDNVKQYIDKLKAAQEKVFKLHLKYKQEKEPVEAAYYEGVSMGFLLSITKAELLLINNARKQSPESPIAQTPCKAKFASEANDLHEERSKGAFG